MAQHRSSKPGFVWIKTTLTKQPYSLLEDRPTFKTQRLLLKPYYEGAAEDLLPMRLQPEVMRWTSQGIPDKDLDETKRWVSLRLPPHDKTNFSFVIGLLETGEVIGTGGCYRRACELGWPEVGYAFRKEAWGKGFASEFLHAFLAIWWKLPREESWVEVDCVTVSNEEKTGDLGHMVKERFAAMTFHENIGSRKVLQKAGFTMVKELTIKHESNNYILDGWVIKQDATVEFEH